MPFQSQSNGYIAYKVQSGLGSQATGGSARILRNAGGQGGRLTKATTQSNEVRRDGMMSRGRHGIQKTGGTYTSELSLGLADDILQAVMRGTWSSADMQVTQSDFTSITTGANTIVLDSGSPISLGFRVGDVIRLTNHASTGNNSRNLRVTALDATTITVAETLTVNATPDTACEITRTGRTLINPAAGSLVERYFTIEEADLDIDGSEVFTDAKWGTLKFAMQPNGIITLDTTWVGTGQFETVADSSAPFFTSPTEPTGVPLSVADATLRVNGEDIVDLTSFDVTLDIGVNAPETFGTAASPYSPDVFSGQMSVAINLTALRQDLQRVQDFADETVYSLQMLAVENEAEPKDFVSLYIGNFTLGGVDKSALNKAGGPRTQTISIPAALVGLDDHGSGFDPVMARFQVSNAS